MKRRKTKIVALDTETCLIDRGLAAPPMVCTTRADATRNRLSHVKGSAYSVWLDALTAPNVVAYGANMAYDAAVVCAQWPDLTDLVFAKYEAGLMRCVQVDQRLIDIEDGRMTKGSRYSLAALAKRWLDIDLAKDESTWRLRYSELIDVPLKHWPEDAKRYAINDAHYTRLIAEKTYARLADTAEDAGFRAYAAFALHLITCRGIVTDKRACLALIEATRAEIERCRELCAAVGLVDAKGKKKLKLARERYRSTLPADIRERLDAAIAQTKAYNAKKQESQRYAVLAKHGMSHKDLHRAHKRLAKLLAADHTSADELQQRWSELGYTWELYKDIRQLAVKPAPFKALGVKITKSGLLSVNADACKLSRDPALMALATLTSANTLQKKAERMLQGSEGLPLQTTYMSPLATGRVSSRASDSPLVGDNFMAFRRSAMHVQHEEGDVALPGQRECIVARPGYVLCSIDLDNAEMRAHAQLAIDAVGHSKLAEVLNRGHNVHRALGADIVGMDYDAFDAAYKAGDPAAKAAAQFAKVPNFQMLGGGGWRSLPDYARGMGLDLSEQKARELGDAFGRAWTEVKEHHEALKESIHKVYIDPRQRIGMKRYIEKYTQACAPHQALTAVAALRGVCWLAREMYTSAGCLRGAYTVLFLHDEDVLELPEDRASEYAWRAAKIICDAATVSTPDVPMTATPTLMRAFCKDAQTITCPHGTLDRDGNPKLLVWEKPK